MSTSQINWLLLANRRWGIFSRRVEPNFFASLDTGIVGISWAVETRNLELKTDSYCPLMYFAASAAATWPVMEPRMRPEPLG